MEVLKKVLIHDCQHCFSRFFTKHFGHDYELRIYKKFSAEEDFSRLKEEYSMVIFMVYSAENLFELLQIYGRGVPVAVCSYNKDILRKLSMISDIMVIDVSRAKTELVQSFNLTLYSFINKRIQL